MNKVTRILLAIGLILAVATPALAEFKLNGYYRLIGYDAQVRSGGAVTQGGVGVDGASSDEEGNGNELIDQRLRLKATYTLNDNVAIVYFAEVDTVWGSNKGGTKYGTSGFGGSVGSDGVNVETKNAYLDLKYGDTAVILGMQGVADQYQGIIYNDDMAGVSFKHKMGNTTIGALYSKWQEDDASAWDDADHYAVGVNQKFSDNFNAGLTVNYADYNDLNNMYSSLAGNEEADWEAFYYGVNAAFTAGNFGVDGFFLFQDGEASSLENDSDDLDTQAMAASAKAKMKLTNGDVGLRVIYFSEQDEIELDEEGDIDGNEDLGVWIGDQGQYEFAEENLMQFLVDKFVCNYGKERYAIREAAESGYGLLAFVASGNHKLPSDMYLNWGAGYFMAMEDNIVDESRYTGEADQDDREGKTLGWEVAARIGKKFFEKVDVSLNGSYANYGSFYDNTVTEKGQKGDPDATYKTYLMVNVPF